MAAKVMTDLELRLSANVAELKKGLAQANKTISGFQKQSESFNKKVTSAFKGVGAAIAGAFALRAIKGYVVEAARLASEVKGVEQGFKSLDNSTKVLEKLKKATRGTVTEMELMKQAIKAENFEIPMDALAAGLEFATKRAAQTGESVDYLVNSFVTGLGRKSVLILDNLGISALRLKEEMAATGQTMEQAVIKVVNEELAKMGDVILTDSQKIAQFNTKLEESKTRFGELILKGVIPFVEAGSKILDSLNNQDKALTKQRDGISTLIKAATNAAASEDTRRYAIEKLNSEYGDYIGYIDAEKISNEDLLAILDKVNLSYTEKLKGLQIQKALNSLTKEEEKNLNKSLKLLLALESANANLYKQKALVAEGAITEESEEYKKAIFYVDLYTKKLGEREDLGNRLATQIVEQTKALEEQQDVIDKTDIVVENKTKKVEEEVEATGILAQLDNQINDLKEKQYQASEKELGAINDQITALEKKKSLLLESTAEVQTTSGPIDPTGLSSPLGDIKMDEIKPLNIPITVDKDTFLDNLTELGEGVQSWLEENGAIISAGFDAAFAAVDALSTLTEARMNRELAAVGNNEEAKDKIRQKYAKKQKKLAVANAIIQGALAVVTALGGSPPPLNFILAALVAAAAAAQVAAIVSTPLAKGGLAYGETFATVGEYPGARSNPEVIAPLNKLQNLLGNTLQGEVVFRMEGTELVGVLKNYDNKINAY